MSEMSQLSLFWILYPPLFFNKTKAEGLFVIVNGKKLFWQSHQNEMVWNDTYRMQLQAILYTHSTKVNNE
jgi:hypothetical protein